ncbi:hypothetical protein ACH4UM_11490 [Streptomyces sp. NPDC020801]|uniref:hypothetical protein n=1 Tax=unclassified Streptomyces TaxID=2593676 RepID=UPI0037A777C5
MPTLPLPRNFGTRVGATALTAFTVAGATWLAAPSAMAQTNGDIRIHRVGVPFGVSKDDPAVCRFYLDATNFGADTAVDYRIEPQPPLPSGATVSGTITLGGGAGHTDPLGLADGQYRITWPANPPTGVTPREKIFRVNCREENDRHDGAQGPGGGQIEDQGRGNEDPGRHEDQHGAAASGRGDGGGPKGGVHAGGGGLARTAEAFSPVTGAAAVGLVVAGGIVYFRMIRRRPHGAA